MRSTLATAEVLRAVGVILGVIVGLIVGFWAFNWVDAQLGGTGFAENLVVFLIALFIGIVAGYLAYRLILLVTGYAAAATVKH
ncbi:MAG TPA: hypothetical protein VJM08_06835 [Anaerolineales bacterium]|nr:hypothetical protein [Anaerolineales bacterium]